MSFSFKPALWTSTALMLVLAGPALAQDAVETAAADFVSADGFEPMAIENIDGALGDVLEGDPNAMIPPDADISPIEKALLMLETQEVPLSRVRYLVRYNHETIDGIDVSTIAVQRFNLGPAIRQDAIDAYGLENTADEEAFGVGPHVEWRFVTQPVAKAAALLLAAGRKEISEDEAAALDCAGRSCLSLDLADGLLGWSEPDMYEERLDITAYPAVLVSDFAGEGTTELSPAYLALQVGIAAGIADASNGVLWTVPDDEIVVVIDRNLGQDVFSDALLGFDDEWTRLTGSVFGGSIYESVSKAEGSL